jgi:hypothetical protein
MAQENPPDPGPDADPLRIIGHYDDTWEYQAQFVRTPEGLKVWSLTITPTGLRPDGRAPEDVAGPGINTRILRAVRFPYIRKLMKERAEAHLARVRNERDQASPENRAILEEEEMRAKREAAGAGPPKIQPWGRPSTPADINAQYALDVLAHSDQYGYRELLRELWSERDGTPLKVKSVDTRMRRLRDDGWLTGYGKLATIGPRLEAWLEANPDSLRHQAKE